MMVKAFYPCMGSRNKEIAKHGLFYGVLNWPSYSTKQDNQRQTENTLNRLRKLPQADKENFYHISKDLNQIAAMFYKEKIKNSK